MAIKNIIANLSLLLLLFCIVSCTNSDTQASVKRNLEKVRAAEKRAFEKTEIICDTIFNTKGFKITLLRFDIKNNDEKTPNTLFVLSRTNNEHEVKIYSDSIFNTVQEVRFADFNNDQVKDILIQNHSDVRSNWTYHLYLVDSVQNSLKKIKGFEKIKNPEYLSTHNLIYNYVTSGTNWTSFYKIKGDGIIDYGISINDNQRDDDSYSRSFDKAIKLILARENLTEH